MTLPDDHAGYIAGFRKILRFFRRIAWVAIFIALVLILTLNARSAAQ
jgi:hypothetical protein